MGTKYYDENQQNHEALPASGAGPGTEALTQVQEALAEAERAADAIVSQDPLTTLRNSVQSGGQ